MKAVSKSLTAILAGCILSVLSDCAMMGVIASSEGYDIKNSSGDRPVRPSWVKISDVRDVENRKIFTLKGLDSEYTKLDAALDALEKIAQRRISEYIDKTIKAKSTDYFWGTNKNGEISGEEKVTSFAEGYTDVKLQGFSPVRYYWELAKEKGKGPYYTVWGEYSIPNDAIEEARKFIKDKEFAESYMARKAADDNKRFVELRDDFSREIEPFFKNISGSSELFLTNPQVYQTRYSHLLETKAQLGSLGSLKGQAEYQNFAFTIKEMVEAYEPTDMLIMSNREQLDRLRREYEGKYIQYETIIARLGERNSALKDEKDELAHYKDELDHYKTENAALDGTNRLLQKQNEDVFALFTNLSGKFEQQQNDDLSRIDSYIERIASWQVPSRQQLNALPKEKKYTVKRGDTLVSIARQKYGSGLYYFWVYRCNRDKITNPDVIRVNTDLYLPDPPSSLNPAALAQSGGTE